MDQIKEVCLKIGETNRFNEPKLFTCEEYLDSKHSKNFNPDFSIDNFCIYCKYEYLLIEKGKIIEFQKFPGLKLQSNTKRSNAWICGNLECQTSPFMNSLETKLENGIHNKECRLKDQDPQLNDNDEFYPEECECDNITQSFSLFGPESLITWEITLCFPCAKKTGIFESMLAEAK